MGIVLAEVKIVGYLKGGWGEAGESGSFEWGRGWREIRVGTLLGLEMKSRDCRERFAERK